MRPIARMDGAATGAPRSEHPEPREVGAPTRPLHFHVRGDRYTGTLAVPEGRDTSVPVVVLGPDWPVPTPAAAAAAAAILSVAGLAAFSYRPGPARGEQSPLRPNALVVALRAAVARLRGEPEIDGDRIGVLGLGPIAGGAALVAAADDPWVKAVCVHDPVMDGASWMKECAKLDDEGWDSLVAETTARLRARTVDVADPGPVPVFRSAAVGEIDLTAFDHLLRFRPAHAVARIPADRLRVTRTGGASGRSDDMVAQSCSWFPGALRAVDYDVRYEWA